MAFVEEGGHTATVFLLRHPQGARSGEMVPAVRYIMSRRTAAEMDRKIGDISG
jgi:hypothetical protein